MTLMSCINNIYFNAAHYTKVNGIRLLHGHTFKVEVCVEGIGKHYVIDFLLLENIVKEIIKPMNYSLLVPKSHEGRISISAPTDVRVKYFSVEGEPTAENLAKLIANELVKVFKERGIRNVFKVRVTVFEGSEFSGVYETLVRQRGEGSECSRC